MINPNEGGKVPTPIRPHPEPDAGDTLRFTDLEVQDQGKHVRGGDGCCQGEHYPSGILHAQK